MTSRANTSKNNESLRNVALTMDSSSFIQSNRLSGSKTGRIAPCLAPAVGDVATSAVVPLAKNVEFLDFNTVKRKNIQNDHGSRDSGEPARKSFGQKLRQPLKCLVQQMRPIRKQPWSDKVKSDLPSSNVDVLSMDAGRLESSREQLVSEKHSRGQAGVPQNKTSGGMAGADKNHSPTISSIPAVSTLERHKITLSKARQYYQKHRSKFGWHAQSYADSEWTFSHGTIPHFVPHRKLPAEFRAWDEISDCLPELTAKLQFTSTLPNIPLLDVSVLPEMYLLRASNILSAFRHALWYEQKSCRGRFGNDHVKEMTDTYWPDHLEQAWQIIHDRLGRERGNAPGRNYVDYVSYNWKLDGVDSGTPISAETVRMDNANLKLLIPITGAQEEHVVLKTLLQTDAMLGPMLSAILTALDASMDGIAPTALSTSLRDLARHIWEATRLGNQHSLKPGSPHHVDPIRFSYTMSVAIDKTRDEEVGLSGGASPMRALLDVFFLRSKFESGLGVAVSKWEKILAPEILQLLKYIGEQAASVRLACQEDPTLQHDYDRALGAYTGRHGYLVLHRQRAFGFMHVGMLAGGRISTTGGNGSLSDARPWLTVDRVLSQAMKERPVVPRETRLATVCTARSADRRKAGAGTMHIELAPADGLGPLAVLCRPGDHIAIWTPSSRDLVMKCIDAFGVGLNHFIDVTPFNGWMQVLDVNRVATDQRDKLSLEMLLKWSQLRPLSRSVLQALTSWSGSAVLTSFLSTFRQNQTLELHDALHLLNEDQSTTKRAAELLNLENVKLLCTSICCPRGSTLYSVSGVQNEENIQLTVARVSYQKLNSTEICTGTSSGFLQSTTAQETSFPIRVLPSLSSRLPIHKKTASLFLFAGGSGLAPFRGFLQQLFQLKSKVPCHLFYSVRTRQDLLYAEELEEATKSGICQVHVTYSREGPSTEIQTGRIDALIEKQKNQIFQGLQSDKALVFVCGSVGFGETVMSSLESVIGPNALDALCEEGRMKIEIFGTTSESSSLPMITQMEIFEHGATSQHPWTVYDGNVYDMTEYLRYHPGGGDVLRINAGLDMTQAFSAAHGHDEVAKMHLSKYLIGTLCPCSEGSSVQPWIDFVTDLVHLENGLQCGKVAEANPISTLPADATLPLRASILVNVMDAHYNCTYPALIETLQCIMEQETNRPDISIPAYKPTDWRQRSIDLLEQGTGDCLTANALIADLLEARNFLVETIDILKQQVLTYLRLVEVKNVQEKPSIAAKQIMEKV